MADNPLDEIKTRLHEAMADLHRARGRKLTQKDLAEMSGFSQQRISDWLNGVKPEPENVPDLARALGVRAGWLYFGELPQYPDDVVPVRPAPPMQPDPGEGDGLRGRPCAR